MTRVKRNIIANYLGSAWGALMGLAFVPLYIHYLGIEAYGLIGVFALLQAVMTLLDMGLIPTIGREMARYEAGAHTAQAICDLTRSMEWLFVLTAATIAVSIVWAAPWLATDWLRAEKISMATVADALGITGGVVAMRWLAGFYRSAITGLQQQVWLTASSAFFATLRGVGVVAVLAWVSPTIKAFFVYQGIVATLEVIVLAIRTRLLLPQPPNPARFRWASLHQVWHFAAGMTVIALTNILLTQVDKLLLSRLLPLTEFGYYSLASTVAGALYLLIKPIDTAAYPRLTELATRGETAALTETYHKLSQLIAVVVIPVAVVLSFFSEHILLMWTRSVDTTAAVAPLVTMLAIGTMLNGLMHAPAALQLSFGWIRLAIAVDVIFVLVLIPAIYFGAPMYGAMAAAVAWLALNLGYIFLAVPLMHRRLLATEMWRWYRQGVFSPLLAALIASVVVALAAPTPSLGEPGVSALTLGCALVITVTAAVLATPLGRGQVVAVFRKAGQRQE